MPAVIWAALCVAALCYVIVRLGAAAVAECDRLIDDAAGLDAGDAELAYRQAAADLARGGCGDQVAGRPPRR